jgi:hypothetical protein
MRAKIVSTARIGLTYKLLPWRSLTLGMSALHEGEDCSDAPITCSLNPDFAGASVTSTMLTLGSSGLALI